jgi:hypothetical protein
MLVPFSFASRTKEIENKPTVNEKGMRTTAVLEGFD